MGQQFYYAIPIKYRLRYIIRACSEATAYRERERERERESCVYKYLAEFQSSSTRFPSWSRHRQPRPCVFSARATCKRPWWRVSFLETRLFLPRTKTYNGADNGARIRRGIQVYDVPSWTSIFRWCTACVQILFVIGPRLLLRVFIFVSVVVFVRISIPLKFHG